MTQLRRARMTNGFPVPLPQTSMVVAGPDGVVSLETFTGVPSVQFHSPKPAYDGDEPVRGGCAYLEGVPCYSDGGTVRGKSREFLDALGVDEDLTFDYLEGVYRREWGGA